MHVRQPSFLRAFCGEAEASKTAEFPRWKTEKRNRHNREGNPNHHSKMYLFGINVIFELEISRKQQM